MKIAVIDSGLGGLSILESIQAVLPHEDYFYCSDNLNFPYGEKTESEIIYAISNVTEKIVKAFHPDLLVVACNTASTHALKILREKFALPIIGVVPAIKPAAEKSATKVIGLLATERTVRSAYTMQLISEFAKDCKVVCRGSTALVQMAEDKMAGLEISKESLKNEILPLLDRKSVV